MNLSLIKGLGVINRTPNSFSDHGLSLNPSFFKNQLESFLKIPHLVLDIGFESTAPMNSAISAHEEWERFTEFLRESEGFDFSERAISFDTYKVQNFSLMAREFKKHHRDVHLIFNDVSGVLDQDLKELLLQMKNSSFSYIYTFTHIPSRDEVLKHMSFIDDKEDIIKQAARSFTRAYEFFRELQMEDRLILDPGFGFSKTYEQNWRLIEHFDLLEKEIAKTHPEIKNAILIGLSKKSFLKKSLPENFSPEDLENLHLKCMLKIERMATHKLLFRVHNPHLLEHIK